MSNLGYFLNGIYDSVRKLRRRAHQHGRVLADGSFHSLEEKKLNVNDKCLGEAVS